MSNVIIIPVHNQVDYLKKCIVSVVKKTEKPIIILVDDGSDEDTANFIKHSGYDYIRHDKAQGFSIACNAGIKYAVDKYEFKALCLLNSDTEIVTNNWFNKVVDRMTEGIGVAGVISNHAGYQSVKFRMGEDVEKVIDAQNGFEYVTLVHGFCFFLSIDVIRRVGLLDYQTFPHYGSEDDYCIKAHDAGFKNIVCYDVYVLHHAEKSYGAQRANIVQKTVPTLINKHGHDRVKKMCIANSDMMNRLQLKIAGYK